MPSVVRTVPEKYLKQIELLDDGYVFNEANRIGRGSEASVHRAYHRDGVYAWKRVEDVLTSEQKVKHLLEGERIQQLIQGDTEFGMVYVVRTYGLYRQANENCVLIKMEYCEQGTLLDAIKNRNLTLQQLFTLSHDLLAGYRALQRANVAHRDIKPENVLIDYKGNAKLADFGFAINFVGMSTATTICGSARYAPPDFGTVSGGAYDAAKHDVYSIGAVIKHLWEGRKNVPNDVQRAVQSFVAGCCHRTQAQRWAFSDALASPFASLCTKGVTPMATPQRAPLQAPQASVDILYTAKQPLLEDLSDPMVRTVHFLDGKSFLTMDAYGSKVWVQPSSGDEFVAEACGAVRAVDVLAAPSGWLLVAVAERGDGYNVLLFDHTGKLRVKEPVPPWADGAAGSERITLQTAGRFVLLEVRAVARAACTEVATTDVLWEVTHGTQAPSLSLFDIVDSVTQSTSHAVQRIHLRSNGKIARSVCSDTKSRIFTHKLSDAGDPKPLVCEDADGWKLLLLERLRQRNLKEAQATRGRREEHVWTAVHSADDVPGYVVLAQLSSGADYFACVCICADVEVLCVSHYDRSEDKMNSVLRIPVQDAFAHDVGCPALSMYSASTSQDVYRASALSFSQIAGSPPILCLSAKGKTSASFVAIHLYPGEKKSAGYVGYVLGMMQMEPSSDVLRAEDGYVAQVLLLKHGLPRTMYTVLVRGRSEADDVVHCMAGMDAALPRSVGFVLEKRIGTDAVLAWEPSGPTPARSGVVLLPLTDSPANPPPDTHALLPRYKLSIDKATLSLVCTPSSHPQLCTAHSLPLCEVQVTLRGACMEVVCSYLQHIAAGFTAVFASEDAAAKFASDVAAQRERFLHLDAASDLHTHSAVLRHIMDSEGDGAAFSEVFALLAANPSYTPHTT